MSKNTVSGIITDDDVTKLAVALGKGQDTFTAEDVKVLVEWAEDITLKKELLSTVLSGNLAVCIENGEVLFIDC